MPTLYELTKLIEWEQGARRVTDGSPLVVPGLLQTADYARAILSRHSDVETRVASRMGRSDVLRRSRNPVQFHALIDADVAMSPERTLDVIEELTNTGAVRDSKNPAGPTLAADLAPLLTAVRIGP